MKRGDVLSDSVRRSVAANSRAVRGRLHVDVEQNLGVVADEADRDDEELADAADCSSISSPRSGPIHGSGVRPAL